MCAKKISDSDIIGNQGIALIASIVWDMRHVWHPTHTDAGIDGYIEIRDPHTKIVTNCILQVQSKATANGFNAETETSFSYLCREQDLDYWLKGNAPVILIVSRTDTKEAYWISVKDYFADPVRRASRKVVFDKRADRFDISCRDRLALIAIPRDSGIYLAPLPKQERLTSNLLMLASLPKRLYRASTEFRTPGPAWRALREVTDEPNGDWVLDAGGIISFRDMSALPWTRICRRGSCQPGDTAAWAFSPITATRNLFVRLLNQCLREKLTGLGVRWSRAKECYFVCPTLDLSKKKFGKRTTFGPHMSKINADKVAYFRHSAFFGQFCCFDRQWYLEITPTYYFTRDGERLDGLYEERLTKIKQIEKNSAVAGQVRMWADILRQEQQRNLISEPYTYLTFADLATCKVPFGIADQAWLPPKADLKEPDNYGLFADEDTSTP